MMILELWTNVRFTLYPVMLVSGLVWAGFMLRHYRFQRCAEAAWAFWLGMAVAIQGASGLVALLVAKTQGFGALSSGLFTSGPLAVTTVVMSGALALWWSAWRRTR